MQSLNWNDLRYLLALHRARSLAGAARLMGVDGTTVSRRLNVLRSVLGGDIYLRQRDGTHRLTELGQTILAHAEAMENATLTIGEEARGIANACAGSVRVTSVAFLINKWLTPQTKDLLRDHPQLSLELHPDRRDFDLTLREADIALRFSRPRAGGRETIARKVGALAFAPYAARERTKQVCDQLPWIGYDESMAHLPQAGWIDRIVKRDGGEWAGLRVIDVETALEAAAAGVGRSLLPTIIADRDRRLRKLSDIESTLTREIWLLVHRRRLELRRVRVVADWIAAKLKVATRSETI